MINFKMLNIDGPDGVGKSLLVQKLIEHYTNVGLKVKFEHFPRYNTDIGFLIQQALHNRTQMDPKAMQLLYSADRLNFSRFEYPTIKENYDLLITDRYKTSGLVYAQCFGFDFKSLITAEQEAVNPDWNIILNAPAEVLMERVKSVGKELDKHENYEVAKKSSEYYSQLKHIVPHVIQIDAQHTPEVIVRAVVDIIDAILK